MGEIRIREVVPDDAAALAAIYAPYVEDTAITFEYEAPSAQEFRRRIEATLLKYPYLAAVNEAGNILGYAYASAFKERAAYQRCVELSIYVRMDMRGQGIGRRLYGAMEICLRAQHVLNANACITSLKEGARGDARLDDTSPKFHEKMGYRLVGRFHDCGWKFGTWHDMIWMEKMLDPHGPDMPPFVPFPETDRTQVITAANRL